MDKVFVDIDQGTFVPRPWMEAHSAEILSAIVVSSHGHEQLQDWCVAFNTTSASALAAVEVPLDVDDGMVVQAVRMGCRLSSLFEMIARRPGAFDTCVQDNSIDSTAFSGTRDAHGYNIQQHMARHLMLHTLEAVAEAFDWYMLDPADHTLLDAALLAGGAPSQVVPFFLAHMDLQVVVPGLGIQLLEQAVRVWPHDALVYLAMTGTQLPLDYFGYIVTMRHNDAHDAVMAWTPRFHILREVYKGWLLAHQMAVHWEPAYASIFDRVDVHALNLAKSPHGLYLVHVVGAGHTPLSFVKRYVPRDYWRMMAPHGETLLTGIMANFQDITTMRAAPVMTNVVDIIGYVASVDFGLLEEYANAEYIVTHLTSLLTFLSFRVNTRTLPMPAIHPNVDEDLAAIQQHFEHVDAGFPGAVAMVQRFYSDYPGMADYALSARSAHAARYGAFLSDVGRLQDAILRCLNVLGAKGVSMDMPYMNAVSPMLAATFRDTLAKQVTRQHRELIRTFAQRNPYYRDRLTLRPVMKHKRY